MTETIERIRVDELKTMRVVCQADKCGGCVEVPLTSAAKGMAAVKCPGCGRPLNFGDEKGADQYAALAKALTELAAFQVHFAVEFLVSK